MNPLSPSLMAEARALHAETVELMERKIEAAEVLPPGWNWTWHELASFLRRCGDPNAEAYGSEATELIDEEAYMGQWRRERLGVDEHAELRVRVIDLLRRLRAGLPAGPEETDGPVQGPD